MSNSSDTQSSTMKKYRKPSIVHRKLGREGAWGQYDFNTQTIQLDPRTPPLMAMDTLVHEALHHLLPDMAEGTVEVTATRLAHILWGQNYRKVSQ